MQKRKKSSLLEKKAQGAKVKILEKNQELTIEITDMGNDGEGIGHADGLALFVKDALLGDIVRVKIMKMKKNYGFARLIEIITPSPYRIEPPCPVARQCGGCQIQHMSYERQLIWKQEKVKNCLERIGGVRFGSAGEEGTALMEPILGMENTFHYRNKAQFPVARNKEGKIIAGFYAGRTHSVIETTHCYIQDSCNDIIIKTILQFMEEFQIEPYHEENHIGLVRHILTRVGYTTGEVMVCLVLNGKKLPQEDELVKRLQAVSLKNRRLVSICLNENADKTNVILGEKIRVLFGKPYIEDYIGDIKYRISPLSFYQVNPVQTRKLYETALEYADLQGNEIVWDLYCGIGTISLFMAKKAKQVYGVEIVDAAVEDAKINAELNGISNAEFFVGAAEEVVPQKYEESQRNGVPMQADVVILDPPRKGCDAVLLDTVVQMQPKKIVYVSCDPATLARDVKLLAEKGYEVRKVRCCDMFGHSGHVESVCLLHRKDM